MEKLASCDRQGSVYLGSDAVYRIIVPEEANVVRNMLTLVSPGPPELIKTSVVPESCLPSGLPYVDGGLVLRHNRVPIISYSHEWCAAMLRDAAICQVELSMRLLDSGIYLKDAHPLNILFDRGAPVFVDLTSLVTQRALFAEDYLKANQSSRKADAHLRLIMLVIEIMKRMFEPYFLYPLMGYAFGDRARIRRKILKTTLNTGSEAIRLGDCIPGLAPKMSTIRNTISLLQSIRRWNSIRTSLLRAGDLRRFYADTRDFLRDIDVDKNESPYSKYYENKRENQCVIDSPQWNEKQKSVHQSLLPAEIETVIDVACNTGWFALMAERLGKRVVAFDIDESSIEILYEKTKGHKLNIHPLVMDFTALTKDRFAQHDGLRVLIDATERLRCDAVLALGILHHLVLGNGLAFKEIFGTLAALCNKRIIIEFVDITDELISAEPSFFRIYNRTRLIPADYDLNFIVNFIEDEGFRVTAMPSHPETRTILVCDKIVDQEG
jgi:SAM-dependent methyltransferase